MKLDSSGNLGLLELCPGLKMLECVDDPRASGLCQLRDQRARPATQQDQPRTLFAQLSIERGQAMM